MRLSFGMLICALTALLGCNVGSVRSDHVVTGVPRAPGHGRVQVVMENAPEPPHFEELGIVRAQGYGSQANLEAVLGLLQTEASEIGANAVIRVRIDQGNGAIAAIGTAVYVN